VYPVDLLWSVKSNFHRSQTATLFCELRILGRIIIVDPIVEFLGRMVSSKLKPLSDLFPSSHLSLLWKKYWI